MPARQGRGPAIPRGRVWGRLNCNGRSLGQGGSKAYAEKPSFPARGLSGLSCPTAPPGAHLRRQQARRARGLGAGAPLEGGLLGRVPQPPRRVQHAGRRRRLRGRLRLRHLLQDAPQLLGAQRGHARRAPRWEREPGRRCSRLTATLSFRLRVRHDGRRGRQTRVAERRRRLKCASPGGKEAATSAPQAKTSRKATAPD